MQTNEKPILKEFGSSTWAVYNRTTVVFILALILFFGLYSYSKMPKEAFPEIVLPQIYVGVAYPGNAPLDMEKLITKLIEKEIKVAGDVDKITSNSTQGYAVILTEFNSKISPQVALTRVKDAVDKARANPSFPTDLPIEPNVFEMNFSEMPILNVNISGDFSIDQLRDYAEYLEEKMENLPQISKVEIRGIQDKEVEVSVDLLRMESMNISFNDIEGAIAYENMTVSGGELLSDDFRRTVRVVGDFKSTEDIESVIVKREAQRVVYLHEIADVHFRFKDATSYAREFTKPVLMLDVVKKSGENLLQTTDEIYAILKEAEKDYFPKNLQITVTNDMSSDTRAQVDNLENSIIFGVLLVVLVLLFFIGLKDALLVGLAIPLSMFMSFVILSAMGVTINIMVLFALILGLGMLVDNGIVVVENVHRLLKEGYSKVDAAKYGIGEIAWPIIASTATTLAAFLPLIFWPGIMGEFMGYLPITLIIVLGSSLFVALVINAALTYYMDKEEKEPNRAKNRKWSIILLIISVPFYLLKAFTLANLLLTAAFLIWLYVFVLYPLSVRFQASGMPALEQKYRRFVSYTLAGKRPQRAMLGMFGLLIFSFVLLGVFTPKVEFFPVNIPKYVNIFIEKPVGADIAGVNEITKVVEDRVIQAMKKYEEKSTINGEVQTRNFLVKSIIAQVGEGTSDPGQGPVLGATPNKARVQVSFVDFQFRRGINTADVMEELRASVQDIPGVSIRLDKDANGPPMGPPINIELVGEDYTQLMVEAEKVKQYLSSKNIPGVEALKLDIDLGKPELLVEVDREKARRLSLSTAQVGLNLRTALYGKEVSRYKQLEDEYPINIRLDQSYRENLDALMNQKIIFRDQTNGQIRSVPISSVAKPSYSSTFSEVKRKNLDRVVTVYSNVITGFNANEVVAKMKEEMKLYTMPKEVSLKFTGQQEEQGKEMAFLSTALLIAIFLIFLIIVAQFNSMGTPFIIMGSIVFSLIGVFLGLVIFQMDFVIIMTMIGIISLAGVVVNNAIVLLDYTHLLIDRKKAELGLSLDEKLSMSDILECTAEAGSTRLRPVLLTAITTVLGLIPLATGMNINFFTMYSDFDPQIYFGGDNVVFWGPMSWTVIFGLVFATFLTLVIVPAMFVVKMKLKYRLSSKK